MTVTSSSPVVPQEIVDAIVLPGGYADLDGVVYPACDWLRAHAPVAQIQAEGYDKVWVIAKHAQVKQVLRDAETFASGVENFYLTTTAGDDYLKSMLGSTKVIDNLTPMDGEEHRFHRSAQSDVFAIENMRKYDPHFHELAKSYVERFLATGGECDAVELLARDYPLQVVMEMISVPEKDFPLMYKMTQETFGGDDPDVVRDSSVEMSPETAARLWQEAVEGFFDYYDVSSAIINGRLPNGDLMIPKRQNYMVSSLAMAGHDTVSSSIAGGLHGLATHPDQFDLVRDDLSLVPGLVEEALRWATPAKHFMRTATRDVELQGQQIKAGDRVMALFVSANRDEDVFPDPYRFDVTRKPNPHMSFSFGPHICLGLHTTKIEMRALYEELIPRLASLELAAAPTLKVGNFVTGFKRLPVRFRAA
jgi:alpha-terpineol hydroxylase